MRVLARDETQERLVWTELTAPDDSRADEAEIARGLAANPKRLPCRLFYDELGSQLFERISTLPEYYLTRTEHGLLAALAPTIAQRTGPCELVELGSGSSTKTRLLIDAYGALADPLRYVAVDVSPSSLRDAAAALLERYGTLEVQGIVGTYEAALAELKTVRGGPRLVLFLGSTIGNLDPAETGQFLDRVRASLTPGDWFLVGTDLRKNPAVIEAAYNDAQGVTAAFNLNILRHVNRRFRGDFALPRFRHVAFYHPERHQIEMHLESLVVQRVTLATLGIELRFAAGERIETEISRKFDRAALRAMLADRGFAVAESWTDEKAWFGLTLARAV